jgi:hypothetical protein
VLGFVGDVRDTVANAIKGNWLLAGASLIGIIPVVGDWAGIGAKFSAKLVKLGESILAKADSLVPSITAVFRYIKNFSPDVLKKVGAEFFSGGAKYTKYSDEFVKGVTNYEKITKKNYKWIKEVLGEFGKKIVEDKLEGEDDDCDCGLCARNKHTTCITIANLAKTEFGLLDAGLSNCDVHSAVNDGYDTLSAFYKTISDDKTLSASSFSDIDVDNAGVSFDTWLNQGEKSYSVYFGYDKNTGTEIYVGYTSQTISNRQSQHDKSKYNKNIDIVASYIGLTKNQARAIEQYYIETKFKSLPNTKNKINSISPKRAIYSDAINWAINNMNRYTV